MKLVTVLGNKMSIEFPQNIVFFGSTFYWQLGIGFLSVSAQLQLTQRKRNL